MNSFKLFFQTALIILVLSSCSHSPVNTKLTSDWAPLKPKQQLRLVQKHTKRHREYNGLHLLYDAQLTFISPKIQINNLKITSQFKNWNPEEAEQKRTEKLDFLKTNSEFFLLFYSPQTKRNRLDQKAASWTAVLKIDGEEFEGEIQKRQNSSHFNSVYFPNMHPWGRSYVVTFPYSTEALAGRKFEIVILAPEGMATFKF